MVWRGALVNLLMICALASPASAGPPPLPPLVFEDQAGRRLSLVDLRGQIVVIVYGTRDAVEESIAWGRRLDAELRDGSGRRPFEIVAVAQMGGIPGGFHGLVRTALRQRTPAGFSLWLDWEDRLSALFGRHEAMPAVVVADREGQVGLVVAGHANGAPWDAVIDSLRRLR